jgi:hypothetical protein
MSATLKHIIHGVRVVGIDLSGPANTKETALLWGHAQGAAFHYTGHRIRAGDAGILEVVRHRRSLDQSVSGSMRRCRISPVAECGPEIRLCRRN